MCYKHLKYKISLADFISIKYFAIFKYLAIFVKKKKKKKELNKPFKIVFKWLSKKKKLSK